MNPFSRRAQDVSRRFPAGGAFHSLAGAACVLGCSFFPAVLWGQALPPTPATASAPAVQVGNPQEAAAAKGPTRHRALVKLSGDQLEVRADNSSLNQILLAISEQTGMKITGGVRDQRVFGTYGPGPAADVLSKLLEDTGANVVLKMTPSDGLAELILSPRTGGPSPPSPEMYHQDPADAQAAMVAEPAPAPPAPRSRSTQSAPPASSSTQSPAQSQVPPLPFSQPAAQPAATDPFVTPQTPPPGGIIGPPTIAPATEPGTTPGPTTQTTGTSDQPSGSLGSAGSQSSGAETNPQSPNGVKTPQQIYQELQKLLEQEQRQQQQQQSGSSH